MMAKRYLRSIALLGLFAMFMAFAGPLVSRVQALDEVRLGQYIDLQRLHCGDAGQKHASDLPGWVQGLEQCGYCDLQAHNPALASADLPKLPEAASPVYQFQLPAQNLPTAPPSSRQPRGPPAFHA